MAATAKKTNPKLWDKVKAKVTRGSKGGKAGQWSARKAQMAVQEYKAEGGKYAGAKSADNHLKQWEREDWGTKSGRKSGETGERLPKKARDSMTKSEYAQTTRKKRADTAKGKQHSAQPAKEARKTSAARRKTTAKRASGQTTRAELYKQAQRAQIPGRSRMTRDELERALRRKR